jgi:hypothetical protein
MDVGIYRQADNHHKKLKLQAEAGPGYREDCGRLWQRACDFILRTHWQTPTDGADPAWLVATPRGDEMVSALRDARGRTAGTGIQKLNH